MQSRLRSSRVSRTLDILLAKLPRKGRLAIFNSPSAPQGQGGTVALSRRELSILGCLSGLECNQDEKSWCYRTVCRFFRAYFRTLSICFPGMNLSWATIDFSCGRALKQLTDIVSLLKDLCTSPMSFLASPIGTSGLLLPFEKGAACSRYLRTALNSRRNPSRAALTFANSCLQMKRVCLSLPSAMVQANLEKHQARIQAPTRQSESFQNCIVREARNFLLGLRLYGSYTLPESEDCRGLTTRSTIESSRLEGGGYGWYQRYPGNFDRSGRFRPPVRYWEGTSVGSVTYVTKLWPTNKQLLEDLSSLYSSGISLRRRVIGLCEPLKVRVITLHHASETNLWGDWQRSMMKGFQRTSLITSGKAQHIVNNEPYDFDIVDVAELRDTLDLVDQLYGDAVIVSDDASAATDSISPHLSARVADATWTSELTEARRIFNDTWTGVAEYNSGRSNEVLLEQTNGQLMGDRRSFPTLCIIHVAAKLVFLRRHRLPEFLRVNGDDGLIVLPRSYVRRYFDFMSELWEINEMKTYVHKTLFSYNSQLYKLSSSSPIGIVKVPLFRWNIIDGIDKSGSDSRDIRLWNKVHSSAYPESRKALWEHFSANPLWHKQLKNASSRGYNWFLPHSVGGLGLENPGSDADFYITPLQRGAIVAAASGDESVCTTWSGATKFATKVSKLTLPVKIGGPVQQRPPVCSREKPVSEPPRIRYGKRPGFRVWRGVEQELTLARGATRHFCSGRDDCPACWVK